MKIALFTNNNRELPSINLKNHLPPRPFRHIISATEVMPCTHP